VVTCSRSFPCLKLVRNPLTVLLKSMLKSFRFRCVRRILALAYFCATGLVPFVAMSAPIAAQQHFDNADQTKILALENVWNLATVHKDVKALDQLLGDSFVGTDWDGSFLNKVQFLDGIKDPNYHPQSVVNENIDVQLHANSAIVTGVYREKGVDNGKTYDHRARFTDTWIFEKSEWRCIASHASIPLNKQSH